MDMVGIALGVFFILVVLLIERLRRKPAPPRGPPPAPEIGDITQISLQAYCGFDYMKPLLLAVQGVVYDVTEQAATLYGPGAAMQGQHAACTCVVLLRAHTQGGSGHGHRHEAQHSQKGADQQGQGAQQRCSRVSKSAAG